MSSPSGSCFNNQLCITTMTSYVVTGLELSTHSHIFIVGSLVCDCVEYSNRSVVSLEKIGKLLI